MHSMRSCVQYFLLILNTCPVDSVDLEVKGHMTVVRFWGGPERGAPVVNIKQVSVWGALIQSPYR